MRRANILSGLVVVLAGCSGPTMVQDAGMDVPAIDATFVGGYQLPQGGAASCAGGACSVMVQVTAGSPSGYVYDVTGTAMIGTDVAVLACSFTGDSSRLILGSMTGTCDVTVSGTRTTYNATASLALQTAVDGGVCTTPELSMTITAMDNSSHTDLRFGVCN